MAIATRQELQNYLELFEHFEKRATAPEFVRKLRQEAFARFWEIGFPTVKDEDWRFTSVAPITSQTFELAQRTSVTVSEIEAVAAPGFANRIVFVNGRFAPELSLLPANAEFTSLAEAIEAPHPLVQQHLAKGEDFRADAFTALNTAFIEDGACIHVKRGAVVEQPIYVLYVSSGSRGLAGLESGVTARMVSPRNLIVADEQSQAVVVEDYVSLERGRDVHATDGGTPALPTFSNVVTELVAGADSVLSHYMIEREDANALNVSTLNVQLARGANVDSHSVLVGGALVRNNVHPVLAGEGADCLINGLFVGNGRQHLDNYMKVEHAAAHCNSRQFYNGILDGYSRGVFHGRIIVHKDAQKTDAKQTNRNLLLSEDAQIDTKPQLEIYADDVKCTHGATIGQMDEEALFYMRSRGIEDAESRRLLLFAFAGECLDRMKPGPVQEWLRRAVPEWLPKKK
jgi:Fe-S cluster assembly protein SufD